MEGARRQLFAARHGRQLAHADKNIRRFQRGQSVMNDRTVAPSPLSVELGWSLVEAFANQPRERPQDVNRGADMIAERLTSIGIPVTMHEPKLFLSLPGKARVEAAGRSHAAKPPAFSKPCPQGLTAPLVHVPPTRNEVMSAIPPDPERYRGRIVITEGMGLPMVIDEFERGGAAGVIAVNSGERIHWGTASTIWGTPEVEDIARLPKIPSVAVNAVDGRALIDAARAGEHATLTSEFETGWFPQRLPVAEIAGREEADQFVFVHGHYDSWQVGVGDNGTGNACMLELARLLWQQRDRLRRSVRFAWWPAHSTGRYGGSAWYLDAHAVDFAERCVIHMNCDSPGCRWATSYESIVMMPETAKAVIDVVRRVTGQTPKPKRPNRSSDYTFYNLGISAAFMASSMMPEEALRERGYYRVGGCGGNIAWHTEDDTLEIADRAVLAKDVELYHAAVLAFATPEVLPIDWRDAIDDLDRSLTDYQTAAGARFELAPAREALAALRGKLDGFYAVAQAGRIPARDANAVIRDLARILVPLNFARKGNYYQDPAVTQRPIPVLALAAELDAFGVDEICFALTSLQRGRNHLVAAARQAGRMVDAALPAA
jgi:Peptidase family M28